MNRWHITVASLYSRESSNGLVEFSYPNSQGRLKQNNLAKNETKYFLNLCSSLLFIPFGHSQKVNIFTWEILVEKCKHYGN